MKRFLIIAIAFLSFNLSAQTVVLERIADLEDELYAIDGTAFLEELDDGSLQLRLSDDYNTLPGPDVRILLNNSVSSNGALEIVNLSNINHFNGAMTFDVPAGVGINDYSHIVFFCVAFNQLWASGSFTDAAPPGGGFVCETSSVSTSNGINNIDICPSDGISDNVSLTNSLNAIVGTNYAYLITDESEIVMDIVISNNFDFEGSNDFTQRVYGVHYDGNLDPILGSHRMNTTSDGCYEHSNSTDFITITKNACPPAFECFNSNVSSGNNSTLDICPTDGSSDFIFFTNSINEDAGEHYAYLITDANENVQEILLNSDYDFEGTSLDEQRVYGIHYDGDLIPVFNSNRMLTTATGCFTHSSNTNFLTITKNACPPDFDCLSSNVQLNSGASSVDICPSDGANDNLQFTNSIAVDAGEHYAYLLTNEDEILQQVINGDEFNFEGSSEATQRVYGIHFDGDLNAQIGSTRTATTATGCFEHSDASNFVEITKNACPPEFECLATSTSTSMSSAEIEVCPSDGIDNIVELENSLDITPGDHYAYLITDENEIVQSMTMNDSYNFEGSSDATQRVYGIHFDGDLNVTIGENRDMTTATGCFTHSDENNFLTITKGSCPPEFDCLETLTATTGWVTQVDICPTDGEDDLIVLKNNLGIESGEHYAYLITDENEIVQTMTMDTLYNFEGSTNETQRVYGIHFDGTLNLMVGEHREMTTATGCFTHSLGTLFLSVTKGSCPTFECLETLTATTDWATEVEVCPTDGEDDIVELRNNLFLEAGMHYAYLITDEDEIVQEMTMDTFYNFEGSTNASQRVYGIHFDGTLDVRVGEHREMTTASGCFIHSGSNLFLTVIKGNCPPEFDCLETLTATTNWETVVDICPTDGEDDIIELRNNLGIIPGEHYAYLITDADQNVLSVSTDTFYNFEGSSLIEERVYGIHYDGTLDLKIGEHRLETTASGCFTHSGDSFFLTITKAACESTFECVESLTATHAWVTQVDICSTDGEDDIVFIQNNIFTPPGENYAFLMTDTNEVLQEVLFDSLYNFEGTGVDDVRIYGISFSGQLDMKIGEDRKNTTATGCFIHSGDNLFLTISRSALCTTSTENEILPKDVFSVYPNPSNGFFNLDIIGERNILNTQILNIDGSIVKDITGQNRFDIDESGVYLLKVATEQGQFVSKIIKI